MGFLAQGVEWFVAALSMEVELWGAFDDWLLLARVQALEGDFPR